MYTVPLSPPRGRDGHLCPGAGSAVQPPQEGFLGCPQRACANWAALQHRGCAGTGTKILFVPGARLTYFFFFFPPSYSLFDSRLEKKRRGHLNFTRHSPPRWHRALEIWLKWIKLTFHQHLGVSAGNPLFVTFQFCRDWGGMGRLLRTQTSFGGSKYWQKGFY